MDEYGNIKILWIWLSEALGAANPLSQQILEAFDNSVTGIYEADESEIAGIHGIKPQLVRRLTDKDLTEARSIYAYCLNEGVGILTPDSELYPSRLKRIQDMPILLYYKGTLRSIDGELCIAVVGTRNMTEYGMQSAYSFSYDFAKAGAVVVSGMARGVDGVSHRAAIDAGGYTVAVLGCGIDRVYPPEHSELMKSIIKNGLIVTEYKPFSSPSSYNFPRRNRIISGMSQATLVIEAPKASGSLITANIAMEQGRDVYAIPGKVGEYSSTGTNELIKAGAEIATSAIDVLLRYRGLYSEKINYGTNAAFMKEKKEAISKLRDRIKREQEKSAEEAAAHGITEAVEAPAEPETAEQCGADTPPPDYSGLSENQRKIVEVLYGTGGLTADEISAKAGISTREVLIEVTMLEISDMITALPGGMYAVK